ncbi:hypothetical protein J2S00_000002 [Caldalkalibacillus uzonensis]|uniref:Uncharacterized protein n=1 Tax=Caldalkalibacillus uzonensis TaxID=353224 RepID=A0ABU0CQE8_9BACI|nr:hypothetical protein [Caldalkalibacillus uzonensis]MDQ0337232.1 hypothetical protein [Caldalkalibacillus uzonensis]
MSRYYALCRANIGRVARIGTRDGRIFDGRISRVTPTHVYLTPVAGGIASDQLSQAIGQTADWTKTKEKGSQVQFFFFPFAIPFFSIAFLSFFPFRRRFRRRPFFF